MRRVRVRRDTACITRGRAIIQSHVGDNGDLGRTNTDFYGLSDNARHVLAAFLPTRELTRPVLGRELSLSKPTVSAAITELERAGLVVTLRSEQGPLGRAAAVYGLAPSAGWLLGIDLGSTRVQLVARGLDGTLLHRFHQNVNGQERRHSEMDLASIAGEQVQECVAALTSTRGPLRAAAIALPKIVPGRIQLTSTLTSPRGDVDLDTLIRSLCLPSGVPLLVENNVNCAALAEMSLGNAQDCEDFIFLQVGVGIGAGIVANRRLLRGAAGGAGEVATIPFPWAPGEASRPFALEQYLGSRQLLLRSRSSWPDSAGPAPSTVRELFELAASGNGVAMARVEEHGRDVGQLASALASVLDPDLIVLGGGVGQNPLLTPGVARTVHRVRESIVVKTSALGDQASVEGAAALAIEHALAELLAAHYQSLLDGRAACIVTP